MLAGCEQQPRAVVADPRVKHKKTTTDEEKLIEMTSKCINSVYTGHCT